MRRAGQGVQLGLQCRQLGQHGGPFALLLGRLGSVGCLARLGDQGLGFGGSTERRQRITHLRGQGVQADDGDGLGLEVKRGRGAVEQRGLHL